MIISQAFQAQTSSLTLLEGKPGRTIVAIQNHDATNPIVVTFGGVDAIISTPNGMQVKAGEFGELSGKLNGKITIISGTGAVDCTVFFD